MIFLKKGQNLIDHPGLVIYDPTGYYEDDATITCASVLAPDEPLFRYEAKFVAYGGMVYAITNEEELMKQVMKLDTKTLFGKKRSELSADELLSLNLVPETEPKQPDVDVREETPKNSPRASGGVVVPPTRINVSNDTPISTGSTKEAIPADTSAGIPDATVKENKTEIIDAVLDAVAPEAVDPSVSTRTKMKKIAKVVKAVTKNAQKNKKIV